MRNVTLTRTATLTLLAAMTLLTGCATVTAPPPPAPPVVIDLCNTTLCTTWHARPWPPRHHEHGAERDQ